MNFISHFYLDRDLDDSLFVVGIATPDLLTVFNREIRLRESGMPAIREAGYSDAQRSFYAGVKRHFEGDRRFHSSDFFKEETHLLGKNLKSGLPEHDIYRSFFVAHVLLELMIDKVLITKYAYLLPTYFNHFQRHEISEIAALTQWVTQVDMPGYDRFMKKFIQNQYLYHYKDWDYVMYVLKRILNQVGIYKHTYLRAEGLIPVLEEYEAGLEERCFDGFDDLQRKMLPVSVS